MIARHSFTPIMPDSLEIAIGKRGKPKGTQARCRVPWNREEYGEMAAGRPRIGYNAMPTA